MIHLDANFLVCALKPGSAEATKLQGWRAAGETLRISSIAWAEFLCGPLSVQDEVQARQLFSRSEPFLTADAAKAAELFNQTGRRSRSLQDCMIAAVALRCGTRLATGNVSDFRPLTAFGLVLA